MAEQIISPGVFTRENDQTFLPQGVGAIGAAIVGPTVKGPAFVPTVVRSFAEYERRFGGLSSETFIPQTVREYLKNAGSVTVTRVLAGGGYTYAAATNPFVVVAVSASSAPSASSNRNILLGVIFPSKATSTPGLESSVMTGTSGSHGRVNEDFSLTLNGTNVTSTQLSASLNPASSNYIFKQLGSNPNNSKKSTTTYGGSDTLPGYTYNNWKSLTSTMLSATTKEAATITFPTLYPTESMGNGLAAAAINPLSSSIIVTDADGRQTTILLVSSSIVGGHANVGAVNVGHKTGSVIFVNEIQNEYHFTQAKYGGSTNTSPLGAGANDISGSDLVNILTASLASLSGSATQPGFTVTSTGASITFTFSEAGAANNVELKGTTINASASVAFSSQGSDVDGYKGVNADRFIIFASQSADMAFNGLSGTVEKYSYASTPFVTSQFLDSNKTTKVRFKR